MLDDKHCLRCGTPLASDQDSYVLMLCEADRHNAVKQAHTPDPRYSTAQQVNPGFRLEPFTIGHMDIEARCKIFGSGVVTNIAQHYVVDSPNGFEWRTDSPGTYDFALNILALWLDVDVAMRYRHAFARQVLMRSDGDFKIVIGIRASYIAGWIRDHIINEYTHKERG